MVARVLIAVSPNPLFRISKPGFDVQTSTDRDDFIIREDDPQPFYPDFTGSLVFAGGGSSQNIALSPALPAVPVVLLKASDGRAASVDTYFAYINSALSQITVRNVSGARTITYFIFGNQLAGL